MSQANNDYRSVYRTPRWVKVSVAITLSLLVLVGLLLLTGEHGPGRHAITESTETGVAMPGYMTPPANHEGHQP